MLDYSCALFDPRGRLLATAIDIPTLLASMGPALRALIDKWGEDINRGDVLLMNHPYMGGVHTSDVNIFVPVFDSDERLVGFSGTVAHHADWGGRLPGTCAASNQSVFEEGVMYPAIKLEEGGRRNQAVYDIIGANVRNPTMNLGDIRAQIAAARTGERRLAVLAERHGSDEFLEIVDGLIAYAAARTRQRIGELADGVYEAEGFLDNDGRAFDEPVRVHARITISGESLTVDLSGSADQRVSGMNCPISTTISDVHYAVRCVQSADVPFNEGCLEPVTLEVPKGNLFNPEFPAATSDRHLTSERLCDVLTRALVQAAPETGSAGWFSGYPVFIPETRSPKTGQRVVLLAQVSGGAGATDGHDGGDALDVHASNCAIIPAETVEMNYSIRVERYELQTDSGGAGKPARRARDPRRLPRARRRAGLLHLRVRAVRRALRGARARRRPAGQKRLDPPAARRRGSRSRSRARASSSCSRARSSRCAPAAAVASATRASARARRSPPTCAPAASRRRRRPTSTGSSR